jgi:hypothetical protein
MDLDSGVEIRSQPSTNPVLLDNVCNIILISFRKLLLKCLSNDWLPSTDCCYIFRLINQNKKQTGSPMCIHHIFPGCLRQLESPCVPMHTPLDCCLFKRSRQMLRILVTYMNDFIAILLQYRHRLGAIDGQPLLDGLLLVVKVGPLLQAGRHLLGADGQVDDSTTATIN